MNDKILITEGLDFEDMEGQMDPEVSVDEYAAKMGKDSDIVTLAFVVKSEQAGRDLVDWFERGYDYVLDAKVSDGQIDTGKWLVFVEMNRRSSVPARIVELLSDLKTLTRIKLKDWTVKVDDEDYDADEKVLKQVIICNPNEYKQEKEESSEELDEMRTVAGLPINKSNSKQDAELKNYKSLAGL